MEEFDINLLPKKKIEKLPIRRKVFIWTIKYGRIIVVLFHLLIISILVYKLNLHSKLNTLSEKIESKSEIIKSLEDAEREIRLINLKVTTLRNLKKESFSPSGYTKLLAEKVPPKMLLKTVIINKNKIKIIAESGSALRFSEMLGNFSSDDRVKDVLLLGAKFSTEKEGFEFDIDIIINK